MYLLINTVAFLCLTVGLLMQCYANGVSIVAITHQSSASAKKARKLRIQGALLCVIAIVLAFAAFQSK